VPGCTPASAKARATTRACPSTLGAVMPTLAAPSLFTALPSSTAYTSSPSARASSSRLSATTPTPLPNTAPLACSSKDRQCPSAENGMPGSTR
jgi:hypothetical protein